MIVSQVDDPLHVGIIGLLVGQHVHVVIKVPNAVGASMLASLALQWLLLRVG